MIDGISFFENSISKFPNLSFTLFKKSNTFFLLEFKLMEIVLEVCLFLFKRKFVGSTDLSQKNLSVKFVDYFFFFFFENNKGHKAHVPFIF